MTRRVALAVALLIGAASGVFAQEAKWPNERPPRPLAAHPVRFPAYEVRTLSNGLQVIAVPHHEEPVVSVRLIVRAGPAQDPQEKPGVASLAATLLDQGTTTKSAAQIATAIDSVGGVLNTGAGADLTYISVIVMKDSLGFGLDLVSDVVQHPAFAPEEIVAGGGAGSGNDATMKETGADDPQLAAAVQAARQALRGGNK